VAFGLFAKLAVLYACVLWLQHELPPLIITMIPTLGWSVAVTGVIGVLCSVLIYVVTHREFWSLENTAARFLGTAAVLGLALSWFVLSGSTLLQFPGSQALIRDYSATLQMCLSAAVMWKLFWEVSLLRHLWCPHATTLKRSAQLHVGPLANVLLARVMCALLGGLIFPWLALGDIRSTSIGTVYHLCVLGMWLALMCGELLERYLFFAGVAAPRMPGSVR
jgi:DMSO reductase anchor subunit